MESSIKCEKNSFFELFTRLSAKSLREQCFSRFSRQTFTFSVQSSQKTALFELFARSQAKSMRKQCFFTLYLRTLYQVCFLCLSLYKVFREFCTKFTKMRKTAFFSFCTMPRKKYKETVFFSLFSRLFVQRSRKMRKTTFFEPFARRLSKSVRKQCFFKFFETFYTKFSKNQRFFNFPYDVPQKV